jgi:WD40 repeat protein
MIPLRVEAEFIVDVKREGHLSALCASILEEEAQKGSRGSFDSIVVTGQRSSIKIWGKFNLKGGAGLRQLREMSCPEGCSDPILVGVLGSQIVVVTSHNIYLVHIESEMWAVAYEAPCPILCAAWSCTRNDKGASLGKGAVLCLGFDGDGLRIMRISDEYEQGMVADNYQMQPFHQISERFHILPADAGLPPRSSTPTGDPSAWCQSRRRGKIGCHIHALSQLTNEDSRGTIVLGISQEHGSPHGIVIMWDTWTGRALFSLPVPAPNPRKLHWSPTSSMLAVSCDVGSVQQQSASPEYDEGASLVLVYLLDPASKSGTCLLRKKFEGEIANIHLMSGLPDLCSASLSSQTSPVLAVIHSDGKVSMEPVTGDDRILRFNRHQCQRGRLSSGHILQLRGTYIIATDTKLSLLAQPAAPVWSGEIDKGRISALSFIFNQDSRHEPSWEAIRSKLAACVAARGEESQVCRTDGSTARCSPPCMTPGVGDNCMPSAWYISSAMKLCVAGWATGGLQVINVESMRSVPVHWTVSGGGITSVTVMPAMAGLCHSRPLLLAGSQDGSLTLGPIGGCGPMSGDACYKLCTPSSRQSPILAIRTFLDAGKDQSAPFHHPFFILCCSEDGNISVWGVPALITDRHPAVSAESNWPLSLVGRMQVGDSNDSSWITCVELLSRDRCMVCCSDGSVEIWEVPMSARGAARILSAPLWSKRMKESIKCVSVSPPMVCGVRVLAAIGEEGEVQLWRKNPGPASEELILIGRSQFSASFDAVALASLSRTSMTVGIALAKGRDVIFFQSSSLALSGVSRSLELEGLNVLPNLFARRRMLESKHLLAPLSSTPSCKQARDFVANGPQLRGATILLDGSGLSGGAVNTLSKQGSKSKTSVIEYRSTTRGSVRIDKRYKLMRQSASAPSTLVAEMDQLPDEASSKLHEVSVPSFSQEQPSLGTEAYDDDYDGTDGNGSDDDGGESEAGQGDGEIPSSLSIPIEPCRRNSTITTSKCMPFLSTKRRRPFQTDTSNLFGASTGMVGAGLAVPLGYSDSQLRCSLHKWKRMRKRPSKRRSTEGSRQRQSLLLPPVTATYITELSQEGAEKEIIMLAADCTHGASQRAPLRRRVVEWSPWVVDDDYHEPSHQKSIDPLAPPPQYICDLFLSLSLGEPWLRLDGALQWELVQRAIAEGVISLYAVKSEFKKAYGGRHKGKNKHDMHDFERFHNFVKEEYFAAPTMELLLRSVGDSSIVLEARGNKKGQVVCIALPRGMQISPLIQSLRNGGSSSQDLISALAVQTALDPKAVFVAPKRALFGPHNQATVEIWGMNPETAYDIYAYAEHDDVGATEGSSSTLEAVQNTLCQVFTLAYTPKEHAHASDIEISWSSLEEAEQAAEVGAAARDRSVKSIATKSNIAVPSEDDFERAKMDPQARNRILAFTKWWAVKGGKEARKDFLQREVRFAFQSPDIRAQAEVDGLSMPDLSVDELQQQSKSSSPSWIFFCAWYSGKAQPTGRMSQTDFSKERMKRRTSFLLARVQRVTQAVDKVRNLLILTRGARKSVSGVEDQKSNTKEKLLRARSKVSHCQCSWRLLFWNP